FCSVSSRSPSSMGSKPCTTSWSPNGSQLWFSPPCTPTSIRTNGSCRSRSLITHLVKAACSLSARSILPVFPHAGGHAAAMLAFWTHRFQSVQAHHREKLKMGLGPPILALYRQLKLLGTFEGI